MSLTVEQGYVVYDHEATNYAGIPLNPQKVITISGTLTLNQTTHLGVLLGIDSSGGAATITLPALASSAGAKYRIFWKTAGNNSTVAAAEANKLNGVIINAATSVLALASNKQTFTFVSGTAITGDWIELVNDGQKWQSFAVCSANGGITVA